MNTIKSLNGMRRLLLTRQPLTSTSASPCLRHITTSIPQRSQATAAVKTDSQDLPTSPASEQSRNPNSTSSPFTLSVSSALDQWNDLVRDPPTSFTRPPNTRWSQSRPSQRNLSSPPPSAQIDHFSSLFGDSPTLRPYTGTADDPLTPGEQWMNEVKQMDINLHLSPRIGRTVQVTGASTDIEKKLRMLNAVCTQNQIRSQFYSQRFHERTGLKRKRLRKERHAKRFKTTFKQLCSRARELGLQGW